MYHVSAQGVDERMINVHYYYKRKKQWMEWQKPVTSPTGHFAATSQSYVVRICALDFQCHGDAFGTTENAIFRAFNP